MQTCCLNLPANFGVLLWCPNAKMLEQRKRIRRLNQSREASGGGPSWFWLVPRALSVGVAGATKSGGVVPASGGVESGGHCAGVAGSILATRALLGSGGRPGVRVVCLGSGLVRWGPSVLGLRKMGAGCNALCSARHGGIELATLCWSVVPLAGWAAERPAFIDYASRKGKASKS